MTTIANSALAANAVPFTPGQTTLDNGDIRLDARFWQSPFAVAAAAVILCEVALQVAAMARGMTLPPDVLGSLTLIACGMLAAGILPNWNHLVLGEDGLEQHSGLTRTKVAWADLRTVKPMAGGLRLTVVGRGGAGVRYVFLTNRYGLHPAAFRKMVEHGWRLGCASLN